LQPRVTESHFVDVRNPYTDKLIFRYDPVRNVVQHQERGKAIIIDLNAYNVDIEQTF